MVAIKNSWIWKEFGMEVENCALRVPLWVLRCTEHWKGLRARRFCEPKVQSAQPILLYRSAFTRHGLAFNQPSKSLATPPLKRDSAEEYRLVQYMDNLGSWSCPCLLDEPLSFTANKVSWSADFGKVHYIRFFIYISHLYGRHSRSLQKIQGQLSTCFHPRNQTFR